MIETCTKCGCPRTIDADHDCVVALAARTEALRARLERSRGVSESDSWLAERGLGTYGPRATGRSLQTRRTRPIREPYFRATVEAGKCLHCAGSLVFRRNPTGGSYHACSAGGYECYYIGFDPVLAVGYELMISVARKVAR